jgi:hypothetical protein
MNSLGARVSAAAAATLVIAGPFCRAQSIEAHEVGTGTGQVSHWETSWGATIATFTRQRTFAFLCAMFHEV